MAFLSRIPHATVAVILALTAGNLCHAQHAQSPESLTLKDILGRLDAVDFDLRNLDQHIEQARRDISHNLGKPAVIRLIDIGEILARTRAELNRAPQLIGVMQRESRTDGWQSRRQEQLYERQMELFGRHGERNRVVQGYADEVLQKFGYNVKDALEELSRIAEEGGSTAAAAANLKRAADQGQESFNRAAQDASVPPSPESSRTPPSRGPSMQGGAPGSLDAGGVGGQGFGLSGGKQIVGMEPDPNDPGRMIVRFADGTTASVPFRRDPNDPNKIILTMPDGSEVSLNARQTPDGSFIVTMPDGSQQRVSLPGAGGMTSGPVAGTGAGGRPGSLPAGVTAAPDGGYIVTGEDGVPRYFPADLTRPGIGTRYLGEKGTRLLEEVEEFLDLAPAGPGGQYSIRQGDSIRWQFAITPTGQESTDGGTRASFRLADRAEQGKYTVTGWRILRPDGSQLAAGAGEEATAVVSQSGAYTVEYSGRTEWGSPFRIGVQVSIAVQ